MEKRKRGRPKKIQSAPEKPKRKYVRKCIPNIVVTDHGTLCRKQGCGNRYNHKVTHTYPNGNRRVKCGKCGHPMILRREEEET